jgi:cell wall-associated NlpC family hydrolase
VSYVDGYPGVLAEISQIQSVFSSSPASAPPSGFEAVLQQVSSLSAVVGSPAPASPATPDLSGSFGYPLEEGDPIAPGTGSSGPPGGGISTGPNGSSTTAGAAGAATAYQLATAGVQTAAAQSGAASQAAGSIDGSSFGASVVADAQKYIGVPYQWGGTNPAQGVDCSGLVQDVFGDLGVSLPRTSQQQATVGEAVPSVAAAQPGDLVFFPGTDGTASAPGHVGIYIGNDQMIDAPYTGATVRVDPVGDPTAIRRVGGPTTSPAGEQPGAVPTTGPVTASSGALGTSEGATGGPASLPASTYGADFASAAASTGVPEALLNAVASTESSFQPGAVSNAGAEGLMQLMPSTATSLGVNPFNPSQAVNAAAKLLSNYHEQFGSWSLALAAYNAGPAAVQAYSGVPPYTQTQNYVQTVLSRAGMEGQ